MTCSETREYIFAFLDNEVDAPLSIELQRHLDGCAGCAQEVEIERTVRKQLARAIGSAAEDVPGFDEFSNDVFTSEAATAQIGGRSFRDRRFYLGRILAAAAAVVFLVGAGAWFVLKDHFGSSTLRGFADLVVADFEHFLEEGKVVQIESADREAVGDWLRRQTALAVALPAPVDLRCKLIGGRKCKIDGRPAAFAVYDMNGAPVSLVAIAGEHVRLEGMTEVRYDGATLWVDHCRGHTVVAYRRGSLLYAVVSQLSEEEISCLTTGAAPESD